MDGGRKGSGGGSAGGLGGRGGGAGGGRGVRGAGDGRAGGRAGARLGIGSTALTYGVKYVHVVRVPVCRWFGLVGRVDALSLECTLLTGVLKHDVVSHAWLGGAQWRCQDQNLVMSGFVLANFCRQIK